MSEQSIPKYLHYSRNPIDVFYDSEIKNQNYISMKPRGLWLSQDEEWYNWCIKEQFSTCDIENCYIYNAKIDKKKLIIIASLQDLENFEFFYKFENKEKRNVFESNKINWEKVYKKYDGIAFENYDQIKKQMLSNNIFKSIWFFGVDINSICIWRPKNVIKEWKLIRDKKYFLDLE